jgi:hypothetical protein
MDDLVTYVSWIQIYIDTRNYAWASFNQQGVNDANAVIGELFSFISNGCSNQ